MGIFGKGKGGGLMNVIRCDEEDYLIWKWRPAGQDVNSTTRENSIRYGSSLRVKDGEVAVFVYKQKDGTMQDFIVGPYDDTIKTANFPVLSSIMGLAFGGESPFQAEIYYINTAGVNQVRFAVPYFDVFDPRLPDHGVPVAVRGTLTFNLVDYRGFIKLHRLINFTLEKFLSQIRDAIVKYTKHIVSNIPSDAGIPVVQMEKKILEINDKVEAYLKNRLEQDFGVNMRSLDISAVEVDKQSPYYKELYSLTAGITADTMHAQKDINIKNLHDMQRINASNMEETLRIQREEAQRAQRLQTETQFIGAHALNRQTDVMQTAAQNMSAPVFGSGTGSSGINPAQFMTSMAVGGALGGQMAGMVNSMGQQMNNHISQAAMYQSPTPPPMPGGPQSAPPIPGAPDMSKQYNIAINGQQYGPYNYAQLQSMVQTNQFTEQTLVWTQGMAQWAPANQVPELSSLFGNAASAPTPPPMPPGM